MPALSQPRAELNPGVSIDRKFCPQFNFNEECDFHVGHHHRHRVNPHFDMEEDELTFYLVGEVPGASAQDISIYASEYDDRTLTISGFVTQNLCPGKQTHIDPGVVGRVQGGMERDHVPIEILGNGYGYSDQDLHENDTAEMNEKKFINAKHTAKIGARRVLLSERQTGEFHRSFSFRTSIVEDAIKASMENGLLFLVVPKKLASLSENAIKNISIGAGKPHDFCVEPTMISLAVV